jgi:HAD superfamily hydrolase (TIGR01509 family)
MKTHVSGPLRAVLFDFDGTLTRPGSLDFNRLREQLNCPTDRPILEYIEALQGAEQAASLATLDEFEYAAARVSEPNDGADSLISFLKARKIPFGLASRNSRRSVLRSLRNFDFLDKSDFSVFITRETPLPPKPDPAPVLWAAEQMGIRVQELLVVGDFVFDIEAGKRAGAPTVWLTNGSPANLDKFSLPPDQVVDTLSDVEGVVKALLPLPLGKLPNRALGSILDLLPREDPSLLVPPGVGEDVCAVELEATNEILVLKSDPITFATDRLAYSSVMVNANDIATVGARPRWFLGTLLFPEGTTRHDVGKLMADLNETCSSIGLTLAGGHTEITDSVSKPVVVGHVAGTVAKNRLLLKQSICEGDSLLQTKAIAIEGTTILARQFPSELQALGVKELEIIKWQDLLVSPGISILEEAAIAANHQGVRAMHDVTEGGISTALLEFSIASGHELVVEHDSIAILPETQRVCNLTHISPWGLIASGSLLIAVAPSDESALVVKLQEAGIEVSRIGQALGIGTGVRSSSQFTPWPEFEADEIVKASGFLQKLAEGPEAE